MTKYCAIFGVCALLTYILLAMVELSFNITLWPKDTRVILGIIIASTALILVGMYNDK